MSVQTHHMRDDDDQAKCAYCEREAHYWSQNELADGRAGGPSVFHCQAHRSQARGAAGKARTKRQKEAATKRGARLLRDILARG